MPTASKKWTISLWIAQILLAIAFGSAGVMKSMPPTLVVRVVGPLEKGADCAAKLILASPDACLRSRRHRISKVPLIYFETLL